jgi:hypothetical protein
LELPVSEGPRPRPTPLGEFPNHLLLPGGMLARRRLGLLPELRDPARPIGDLTNAGKWPGNFAIKKSSTLAVRRTNGGTRLVRSEGGDEVHYGGVEVGLAV